MAHHEDYVIVRDFVDVTEAVSFVTFIFSRAVSRQLGIFSCP